MRVHISPFGGESYIEHDPVPEWVYREDVPPCDPLTVTDEEPWTHRADPEAPTGRIVGVALLAFAALVLLAVAFRAVTR